MVKLTQFSINDQIFSKDSLVEDFDIRYQKSKTKISVKLLILATTKYYFVSNNLDDRLIHQK
jgi:hypothetical protein